MSALKPVAELLIQYWRDANQVAVHHRHHVQRLARLLEAESAMKAAFRTDLATIQHVLEQRSATDWSVKGIIEKLTPDTPPVDNVVKQSVHVQGCGNTTTVVGRDMIAVPPGVQAAGRPASPRINANVFINYRRSASQYFADKIYHSLLAKLNGRVFYDIETTRSGMFLENLLEDIRQSHVVVSVISHGTLDHLDETGDWVRREIAEALRLGKPIILVIDDDTPYPTVDILPDDVQALAAFHGVRIHPDSFDAGIEKLLKLIAQAT